MGVVSDEVLDECFEIREAVVDRCCGQQHDFLGDFSAQDRPVNGLGAGGCRIAEVVRLVDDNHGVLFDLTPERFVLGIALVHPVTDLLVGENVCQAKAPLVQERLPHALLEGCRTNDEHTLTALFRGAVNHFARQEGLAQTDFIGNKHTAEGIEQPLHSGHAVALESGEVERG